jgi:hypothetical protein
MSTPDSYPGNLEAQHEDEQAKAEAAAREAEAGPPPAAEEVLRMTLNQIAELDAIEAEAEQRFADFWGGTGPDYEAQASQADRDAENEAMWWAENDATWRQRPGGEAAAEADEPEPEIPF